MMAMATEELVDQMLDARTEEEIEAAMRDYLEQLAHYKYRGTRSGEYRISTGPGLYGAPAFIVLCPVPIS
jgi:hypothetical protein